MKFKDDYGNNILLLDEENLIYKSFFRKIVIKRSDIRSVFYAEDVLGILTYSGKTYSLVIRKLLYSERKRLEDLRLELSKENILFDYNNSRYSIFYLYIGICPMIFNTIISTYSSILKIFLVLLVISFIFIIIKLIPNTIYNIDKDEIEIFKWKNTLKYKREELDKINLINTGQGRHDVIFYENKKGYRLNFVDTPYLYKIYSSSLNKLFT